MRGVDVRSWAGTPAACLAGFLVRLQYASWEHPYRHADITDYKDYLLQAEHFLSHTSGPEDTFMPFGLSFWIALGSWLHLPTGWLTAWQVVAGTATVALIALAARRMTGSPRAGAAAGWLAALYPPFVYYQGFLFTETSCAALVALALAAASDGLERPRDRAITGLTLGAAAVFRTNLGLVPLIWAAGALAAASARRRSGPATLRVVAWSAVPIAAAVLRASVLVGAPTGPATNGAVNFLLAHSDYTEVHLPYEGPEGSLRVIHFFRNHRRAQDNVYQAAEPVYREHPLYAEALRSMRSNPARELRRLPMAWLDGMGLGREGYYPHDFEFYSLVDADALMDRLRVLVGALVVVPAVAWAALRLRRREPALAAGEQLLLAAMATAFVTFTLFLSEPRMRVPFDPAFVLGAVMAWRWCIHAWHGRVHAVPART